MKFILSVMITLLCLSKAIAQINPDAQAPVLVEKEFELKLKASVQSCMPKIELKWFPQVPNIELGITDSIRIEVKIEQQNVISLGQWSEKYSYETKRKKRKKEYIDTNYQSVLTPIKVKYGDSLYAMVDIDGNSQTLRNALKIEKVFEEAPLVKWRIVNPTIPVPNTEYSGRNSKQVEAPCASLNKSDIDIGRLEIKIVRRYP